MKIDPDLMLACASVLAHPGAYAPDDDPGCPSRKAQHDAVRGSARVVAARMHQEPTECQITDIVIDHFAALLAGLPSAMTTTQRIELALADPHAQALVVRDRRDLFLGILASRGSVTKYWVDRLSTE